jgi:hypothetical protein
MEWIDLAEDRDQWRANFRVAWNVRKFSSGCTTGGLSRRVQVSEVTYGLFKDAISIEGCKASRVSKHCWKQFIYTASSVSKHCWKQFIYTASSVSKHCWKQFFYTSVSNHGVRETCPVSLPVTSPVNMADAPNPPYCVWWVTVWSTEDRCAGALLRMVMHLHIFIPLISPQYTFVGHCAQHCALSNLSATRSADRLWQSHGHHEHVYATRNLACFLCRITNVFEWS